MLVKDLAKRVIDSLPDDASLDDIMHALYVQAKFSRGEQEIREGEGVPQEEARQRIQRWVR